MRSRRSLRGNDESEEESASIPTTAVSRPPQPPTPFNTQAVRNLLLKVPSSRNNNRGSTTFKNTHRRRSTGMLNISSSSNNKINLETATKSNGKKKNKTNNFLFFNLPSIGKAVENEVKNNSAIVNNKKSANNNNIPPAPAPARKAGVVVKSASLTAANSGSTDIESEEETQEICKNNSDKKAVRRSLSVDMMDLLPITSIKIPVIPQQKSPPVVDQHNLKSPTPPPHQQEKEEKSTVPPSVPMERRLSSATAAALDIKYDIPLQNDDDEEEQVELLQVANEELVVDNSGNSDSHVDKQEAETVQQKPKYPTKNNRKRKQPFLPSPHSLKQDLKKRKKKAIEQKRNYTTCILSEILGEEMDVYKEETERVVENEIEQIELEITRSGSQPREIEEEERELEIKETQVEVGRRRYIPTQSNEEEEVIEKEDVHIVEEKLKLSTKIDNSVAGQQGKHETFAEVKVKETVAIEAYAEEMDLEEEVIDNRSLKDMDPAVDITEDGNTKMIEEKSLVRSDEETEQEEEEEEEIGRRRITRSLAKKLKLYESEDESEESETESESESDSDEAEDIEVEESAIAARQKNELVESVDEAIVVEHEEELMVTEPATDRSQSPNLDEVESMESEVEEEDPNATTRITRALSKRLQADKPAESTVGDEDEAMKTEDDEKEEESRLRATTGLQSRKLEEEELEEEEFNSSRSRLTRSQSRKLKDEGLRLSTPSPKPRQKTPTAPSKVKDNATKSKNLKKSPKLKSVTPTPSNRRSSSVTATTIATAAHAPYTKNILNFRERGQQIDPKDLFVYDTLLGEGQVGCANLAKYKGILVACKSKRRNTSTKIFNFQIQRELKFAAKLSVCRYVNRYIGWTYCRRSKVEEFAPETKSKLYVVQRYVSNGDARTYLNNRGKKRKQCVSGVNNGKLMSVICCYRSNISTSRGATSFDMFIFRPYRCSPTGYRYC
jgi:hypothetical protein